MSGISGIADRLKDHRELIGTGTEDTRNGRQRH
jgi:hypothetical protein